MPRTRIIKKSAFLSPYLHLGNFRSSSSRNYCQDPSHFLGSRRGFSKVVRTLVVLPVGPQAHPVDAAGQATSDERTHPVDPYVLIHILHHGWAQSPGRIHAAAGDGDRRHMRCHDRQADRHRGPTPRVGPLGIRHRVHHQHQQERNDDLHYDTLGYRHAVTQHSGAESASSWCLGYYQLDGMIRFDEILRGKEELLILRYMICFLKNKLINFTLYKFLKFNII